jgi:hypothetical protein
MNNLPYYSPFHEPWSHLPEDDHSWDPGDQSDEAVTDSNLTPHRPAVETVEAEARTGSTKVSLHVSTLHSNHSILHLVTFFSLDLTLHIALPTPTLVKLSTQL